MADLHRCMARAVRSVSPLGGASRVIAPSDDAARRIRIFFPALSPVVWPHPEPEPAAAGRAVRVLVPGAMSLAKGLEVLEACVADSARRNLGLFFRVLGFVARPMATWPQAPLSISGEFADGTLDALIAAEGGDVCFFPAQCPEVFSYTLSQRTTRGCRSSPRESVRYRSGSPPRREGAWCPGMRAQER
jgi:hypothetical protein